MNDTRPPLDTSSGILKLDGWKAISYTENDTEIHVEAEPPQPDPAAICYNCGMPSLKVKFGYRIQEFADIPVHDKRVIIHVKRHRYRCQYPGCNYTFVVFNEDMHHSRMMTKRLAEYIGKQSFKEPFTNLAKRVGVDEKTVRLLFADEMRWRDSSRTVETPRILGIDELYLGKQYRCILVDLDKHQPIDLLETRTKKAVIRYLSTLDKSKVDLVAMDMWNPYREAVHAALPGSHIIVDKFHITRMANEAMETVRKRVRRELRADRKKLQSLQLKDDRKILLARAHWLTPEQLFIRDTWIDNIPALDHAYDAKEWFLAIWDSAGDRASAEYMYERWLVRMDNYVDVQTAFAPIVTAMKNWHTEIFNYWDAGQKVTNAYTEALNGLLKLVNRRGRGYSFKVVRAKLLYGIKE